MSLQHPFKIAINCGIFLTERIFGTELEQSPTVNWTERSLKILNVNFWTDLFLERKQACPYRSLCHRNLLDLFPVIFLDGSFTISPPPLPFYTYCVSYFCSYFSGKKGS